MGCSRCVELSGAADAEVSAALTIEVQGWVQDTALHRKKSTMGYPTFVIATCVKALYEANAKVEGVPSMWGEVASKYVTTEYREASVTRRCGS